MKRVVLFSGGMDSLAAWRLYAPDASLCYVRIGAPYEGRELRSILDRGFAGDVQIVQASETLGEAADKAGRVPLRNLLFAVTAAADFEADEVVLGALAGETSPDKSRRFAAAASAAMSASEGRRIRLTLPFRRMTKAQLVAAFLRAHPRMGAAMLRACPSCYAERLPDGAVGCGRCMSCLRRWVAMSLNGIEERYAERPWTGDWLHRDRDSWLGYLRRTPARDWPGVARANWELLRALRRYA